jgi:hypothetical protein
MAGKSIAPLLLLGGAAVALMSGKKMGDSGRLTGPALPDGVPLPPPLPEGVIGPRTKDAIITAIDIQNEHGSWPDFVKQAAVQYGEA